MRNLLLFLIASACGAATIPLYIDTDTNTVVSPDAPTTLSGYGITDGGLPSTPADGAFLVGDGADWVVETGNDVRISLGIQDLNWGGGFVGTDAVANTGGGAIGLRAETASGGAIGSEASSLTGGAVGSLASETGGGGAVGSGASATNGAAVGLNATAQDGAALGLNAIANGSGRVQLGAGTNSTDNTIQFRDSGSITAEQLGRLARIGFVDYNDASGDVSLTADTWTDVPNDTLGAFTNTTYIPSNVTTLIDDSTGHLDFTDLELGQEISVRNDFTITPNTNNALLQVRYVLGTGAGEYALLFWSERLDSGSGVEYQRVITFPIYMGDTNTRDNPGKLQVKLSTPGTLNNNGSYISIR